jgi:uncharacterized protein (DUF433 family)
LAKDTKPCIISLAQANDIVIRRCEFCAWRWKGASKSMAAPDRIEVNPKVMLGKPVIRGTRVPVELLLRKLSEGATESELLDAYPRITRRDIQAAIRYAADTVAHEETFFVTPKKRARG